MNKDIVFNKIEEEFYKYLFESHKKSFSNYIDGREVAGLFMKSNLNKEILKKIWEFSAFRKEKELNIQEFFLACRCVKLCQLEIPISEYNLKSINNDNRLPKFTGIDFNISQSKINDDDDEFIEIEEKQETLKPNVTIIQNNHLTTSSPDSNLLMNDLSNFNIQQSVAKKAELNPSLNTMMNDNNPKPSVNIPNISPLVENDKKKNIEDLFDLLNPNEEKPKTLIEENKNQSYNNIVHNNTDSLNFISPANSLQIGTSNIPSITSNFEIFNLNQQGQTNNTHISIDFKSHQTNSNANILNENNNYDDENEFVDIEENTQNDYPESIIPSINLPVEKDMIQDPNKLYNFNSNHFDLEKIYVNNSNANINNDVNILPQTKEDKQIDFQKILLDNKFQPQKKIEEEVKNENTISYNNNIPKSNFLLSVQDKQEEKTITTLDDLLNIVDVDLNPKTKTEVSEPEISTTQKQNDYIDGITFSQTFQTNKIEENNLRENKENSNKNIMNEAIFNPVVEDEFCEVEETPIDHKEDQQIQNTNTNENILMGSQLHFINQETDKEKRQINLQNPEILIDLYPHNDHNNKVSIINYTPEDFLNDFKKEHKHADENEEFEFTAVEENIDESIPNQILQTHLEGNIDYLEYILKHKLIKVSLIEKFKSNLKKFTLASISTINEMNEKANKIYDFIVSTSINKYKFDNDWKLDNFIKSLQQIFIIGCKIFTLLTENEKLKGDLNDSLIKVRDLLKKLLNFNSEIFEFRKFFQTSILEKFENFNEVKYKFEPKELSNKKICFICLYDNEYLNESVTNLMSYDFHISCINLWLNKIDKNLPLDLDM